MRAAIFLGLVLLAACGRSESYSPRACTRLPQKVPELAVQMANGFPRLWNREACVAVTYAPALQKLLPNIRAALDAWGQVDCTGLCFEAPVQRSDAPSTDSDLRLHFADNGGGSGSAWELLSDGRSGRTLHATVFVSTSTTLGDCLKQVGFVLGFESKKLARDSVLEDVQVANPRTALGAIDKQSVCAMYPSCR